MPWRARLLGWLEAAQMREQVFVIVVAIAIGVLCGFGAVGFRFLIGILQQGFWGEADISLEALASSPIWRRLWMPAVGGLIVGPIVYFFAREARGHGVPEVMGAIALRNGIIRIRVALAKAVASAFTIASGGSAGREGPIIQIGAAIGSGLGQLLGVSRRKMRTFVGCGAAAGIAATFNAPIAGALFSVEVILGNFGVSQFAPIVISSVLATVVAQHYFGAGPVFHAPHYELGGAFELGPYAVLGLLCGLVSFAFIKVLYFFEDGFEKRTKLPGWLQPAIGGLLLGILGLGLPHIYGDGQEVINRALANDLPWKLMLLLLFAKLAATSFTLGSGGSGGVFAPSLFMGAMAGGVMGQTIGALFGVDAATAGGYALVGMGGVVAGTTHAPITAILIIFEITSDYPIILPLMLVCILSILVSTRLSPASIYTLKLIRRGVDLFQGRSLDVLKSHKVEGLVRTDLETVEPDAPAASLLERMLSTQQPQFYAVDEQGRLEGVIPVSDLGRVLTHHEGLEQIMLAADLASEGMPICLPEENLSSALVKFEQSGATELPVIQDIANRILIGSIHYADVVARYNHEMISEETASTLAERIQHSSSDRPVRIFDEFHLVAWDPPARLIGQTLVEAALPSRYGVRVILVKKRVHEHGRDLLVPLVPGPDYCIAEHDTLIIYGLQKDLERIQRL